MTSTGSVRAVTHTLKELFAGYFYKIDYYQREYAWSSDDVRTLIEDLFEAFKETWQNGNRRGHYSDPEKFFLGPFVFAEEGRTQRYLVDGQQRFTTIHLIFMHLRNMAADFKLKGVEDNLGRAIGEFDHGRLRFRIDIDERQALLTQLYNGKGYEPRPGAQISVRNMASRSELISELLDGRLTSDSLPDFVEWLLNCVLLVGIKAGNKASGHKIFESMNDRGARLTPADLVKSFLISKATKFEIDLNRRWQEMLSKVTIDREDANAPKEYLKTALIAHYAQLGDGQSDASEIETSLNAWVHKNSQDRLGLKLPIDYYEFLNGLLELSAHYVRMLRATKRPFFENNLQTLFYNNANGLTGQLAAVLAPIRPADSDSVANAKAALVANYIDRLYVSRMLGDDPLGNRDFDDEFHSLIMTLRSCQSVDEVAEILAARLPEETFEALGDFRLRGNNRRQVRYFLARLTAYVEVGLGKRDESDSYIDGSRWHIEHLWPVNQKQRPQDFPDPVDFRVARSRIGALTLLPGRDNEAYQDLPFDKKAQYYGKQPNLTAIFWQGHLFRNTTAREFAAKNQITDLFHDFGVGTPIPEVIRARIALYQALASKIWAPARLGLPVALSAQQTAPSSRAKSKPKPRPGTVLSRLVKAQVIPVGAHLLAANGGYAATVDKDGIIWLPTGDAFSAVDEAANAVSGEQRCDGLKFWQVEMPNGLLCLRDLRDHAQANGQLRSKSRQE
jgi:Protein of unknown function DUF262/Restriction Enzyme Adenine Methylase Associated/Protein of unknown function (DUF1524)